MTDLLDEVKRALEPFAQWADYYRETMHDHYVPECEIDGPGHSLTITLGDFRRARSALAALEAAGGEEMVEMVEKVAMAIYEAASGPWDFASEYGKDMLRHEARAALAAMGVK